MSFIEFLTLIMSEIKKIEGVAFREVINHLLLKHYGFQKRFYKENFGSGSPTNPF